MHTDRLSDFASTLSDWCLRTQLPEQVLSVVVGERPLHLVHKAHEQSWVLPAGWRGLLAFCSGLSVVGGEAQVIDLAHSRLVKLQVFIDQALSPDLCTPLMPFVPLAVDDEQILLNDKMQQDWYITQSLAGNEDHAALAQILRQGESYRLVLFLLQQGASSQKLHSLARRYGVSVSHFRRLCSQALGGAAKTELREWRSAQALLALAQAPQKPSLTNIALEFGFASSSHFSKEIRELLGVAPSSLVDITCLPSK